ncbi:phosphoglycerate mutase-like protein [Penicillium angulare]|uniref:Phosphoglycerate mutase-like protein n=1 Tax=Penicillium angulare TaxID=116970 RepID=A0A9W9EG77_9EURO|nr:phosphoglycerate mutase-like protein [Penicillium angulare]
MPPRLHLGHHNLGPEYWGIIDPLLTERGKQQCMELGRSFPYESCIDLVVTSPMRRAIYTGLAAFESFFNDRPGTNLIVHPDLQEVGQFPCDVGSTIPELLLEKERENLPIDIGLLTDDWTSKEGRYQAIRGKIQARALNMRCWLRKRPEKDIAVVSHGAFLHFLTDDWEDACKHEATSWANTEHRVYNFVEQSDEMHGNDEASMQETTFSRERRGKTGPPLNLESQRQLREIMLDGWVKQGYPVK